MKDQYYIVKDKKDNSIAYFNYDKLKSLDLTPKKNAKIKDSIEINKIIIINPSLIEKVIKKKMQKRFCALLNLLNCLYDEETTDPEGLRQALNEINKFRLEIRNKYKNYLKEEELEINEKKLRILENEVKLRINELDYPNNYKKEGKNR